MLPDGEVEDYIVPVIAPVHGTTLIKIVSGTATVTDVLTASNDNLTITKSGNNVRVTDPNNVLEAGTGVGQIDAHTVEMPLWAFTTLAVNTLGGSVPG